MITEYTLKDLLFCVMNLQLYVFNKNSPMSSMISKHSTTLYLGYRENNHFHSHTP